MGPFVSVLISGDRQAADDAARRALAYLSLDKCEHEIVSVTDGSLKDAFLSAKGRYIVVAPAGSGTPVKEADKLIAALESGAAVASGTRFHSKKNCDVQFKKGKRLGARLKAFFFGSPASDPFHGFQAFNAEKMKPLVQAAPDLPAAIKTAKQSGLKIVNVPVMYKA